MINEAYVIPIDKTGWELADGTGDVRFTWDYDNGREKLLNLYRKGKNRQWDSEVRIDWDLDLDLDDPLGAPEELIPIYGSETWSKLGEKEKSVVRRHLVAWQFSQFLHGEQGALICTAKIVQTVPDIDSKYYAATQVMDEARHVETYSRYLDKIDMAYPINPNLRAILDDVLTDSRWDMTYLGMQVLIEGLALAAFGGIRTFATDPLSRAVNAYVMQDEARHVMFGRLALRDYYPHLTSAEIAEREEFTVEACWAMRDRFLAEEVWETLDFDVADCIEFVKNSEGQKFFRGQLFSRIVPTLRDIGLWGKPVRTAFEQMDVLNLADTDLDSLMSDDERIADEIEIELNQMKASRDRDLDATIAAGAD
ncbi:MAG: ferritin-like domain-containing protein [Acidobacteria bacterium]|nr:ferritin-like domain-containing protein [Acidobacteriota bacterium]